MPQFSPELCRLESLNTVYLYRMSDYIVGLTQDHGSYFSIFHPFFFLSSNYKLTLKLVSEFSQELLKLEC